MYDFRCKKCKRLLAKERVVEGEFEIKCKKCKTVNTVIYRREKHRIDTSKKPDVIWSKKTKKAQEA